MERPEFCKPSAAYFSRKNTVFQAGGNYSCWQQDIASSAPPEKTSSGTQLSTMATIAARKAMAHDDVKATGKE